MRHATLSAIVIVVVALTGCPGGGGSIGDRCEQHNDCDSALQCVKGTCVARCQRAPECGDGYRCDDDGVCRLATGQRGDSCTSEVDCAPGLSCQIDFRTDPVSERLVSSCTEQNTGAPAGEECEDDDECRNGTCSLGHCIDLCAQTRDCEPGNSCMAIPHIKANGALFDGCLVSQGNIAFPIEVLGPSANILLPVPSGAHFASVVFSVGDVAQSVGATEVIAPSGTRLLEECRDPVLPTCNEDDILDKYYSNPVRHRPEPGASVLAMPSNLMFPLETGAYQIAVSSFRANGTPGSAIPSVTGVIRIESGALLDLHFYFLDLTDHPCDAKFGDHKLDAAAAQAETYFQSDFLGQLRTIFAGAGVALSEITYEDILDRPDLDGLDVRDLGSLLELGRHPTGINVFFVRTLSPVGLQAFGPGPGPAGLGGTRRSGIVIGVDTLCYRTWQQLARVAAHEAARYMGLYRNAERELDVDGLPRWEDPIGDNDTSTQNLMSPYDLGGTSLSPEQRKILGRSPVLR